MRSRNAWRSPPVQIFIVVLCTAVTNLIFILICLRSQLCHQPRCFPQFTISQLCHQPRCFPQFTISQLRHQPRCFPQLTISQLRHQPRCFPHFIISQLRHQHRCFPQFTISQLFYCDLQSNHNRTCIFQEHQLWGSYVHLWDPCGSSQYSDWSTSRMRVQSKFY